MKKIKLLKFKYSMLFFDILCWLFRVNTWSNLRRGSKAIYKIVST